MVDEFHDLGKDYKMKESVKDEIFQDPQGVITALIAKSEHGDLTIIADG